MIPEWLCKTEEIDVDSGLVYCGDDKTYMNTVIIYAESVQRNADEIENSDKEGDTKNTIIKVHALKSTSRAIGAGELSALAEKLEKAGKAGDIETLKCGLPGLLECYRRLGELLSPLTEQDNTAKQRMPITDTELRETYAKIAECADGFDIDGLTELIDKLKNSELPDRENERFAQLKDAADDFDYDRIAEILQQ